MFLALGWGPFAPLPLLYIYRLSSNFTGSLSLVFEICPGNEPKLKNAMIFSLRALTEKIAFIVYIAKYAMRIGLTLHICKFHDFGSNNIPYARREDNRVYWP